ncbi:hypothetical protein RND71_024882 [Anisodus tanguticus]|uniref:Uncharacterized protein n=1 Tax=Anisodus tanguticus TaxID=243964 RepID=A0AAE1RRW1_9SOLA|nr:hypothetical protein RND71_024882 [Anisodus tanguticus]
MNPLRIIQSTQLFSNPGVVYPLIYTEKGITEHKTASKGADFFCKSYNKQNIIFIMQ